MHVDAARDQRDAAGDVRLAVAHLCSAVEGFCRCAPGNPVRPDGVQAHAMKRRMAAALDDNQGIASEILGGDEPGRLGLAPEPADAESAPLAERVALEATMLADDGAIEALDRARAAGQPLADEVPERALADETDAGRIALPGNRYAAVARDRTNLGLAQAADRKLAESQLRRIERMQEVTLVLFAVEAAEQPGAIADSGIVTGRKALGAQAPGVVEADAELHFPVTGYVGIGRATGLEFREEPGEYAFAVLGRKVRLVQRDLQLVRDASCVLEVGRGSAIAVVVLAPVRHEQRLDLVAGVQ